MLVAVVEVVGVMSLEKVGVVIWSDRSDDHWKPRVSWEGIIRGCGVDDRADAMMGGKRVWGERWMTEKVIATTTRRRYFFSLVVITVVDLRLWVVYDVLLI